MPTDNKIIHQCSKCSKIYKTKGTLQKHASKCNIDNSTTSSPTSTSQENNTEQDIPKVHENTYDINMKFVDGNKVKVEVHKQGEDGGNNEDEEEMKLMSRKNSYYKNNIMLATFILDNCRKDPPETDEEFENIFE